MNGLADLTEMAAGARTLTRLLNRPAPDAKPVVVAPGCVLFANGRGGKVLTFAQQLPVQSPGYHDATLFSESYRDEIVRWLTILGGGLPGGVCHRGVGPMTCMAGETAEGARIVVLNALDLDGDDAPELMFDVCPARVERLQGDGRWREVALENTGVRSCRLQSPVAVQRPAIFRLR